MAIRPILIAPDVRLKEKSKPVEGPVTDELRALMDDMLETMYEAPGIGLAAIQVGEPLRVIVMDLSPDGEPKAPRSKPIPSKKNCWMKTSAGSVPGWTTCFFFKTSCWPRMRQAAARC